MYLLIHNTNIGKLTLICYYHVILRPHSNFSKCPNNILNLNISTLPPPCPHTKGFSPEAHLFGSHVILVSLNLEQFLSPLILWQWILLKITCKIWMLRCVLFGVGVPCSQVLSWTELEMDIYMYVQKYICYTTYKLSNFGQIN